MSFYDILLNLAIRGAYYSWLLIPVFLWTGYRIIQKMRMFESPAKKDVFLFVICAILLYLPLVGNYMWNVAGH